MECTHIQTETHTYIGITYVFGYITCIWILRIKNICIPRIYITMYGWVNRHKHAHTIIYKGDGKCFSPFVLIHYPCTRVSVVCVSPSSSSPPHTVTIKPFLPLSSFFFFAELGILQQLPTTTFIKNITKTNEKVNNKCVCLLYVYMCVWCGLHEALRMKCKKKNNLCMHAAAL